MAATFDFSKTSLAPALAFDAAYPASLRSYAPLFLWALSAVGIFGGIVASQPLLLSIAFLIAAAAALLTFAALFFDHGLAAPEVPEPLSDAVVKARSANEVVNLAAWCTFGLARLIYGSGGKPAAFIRLLSASDHGVFVFSRLGIAQEDVFSIAGQEEKRPEVIVAILGEAAMHAARRKHLRIETGDALLALAQSFGPVSKLLFDRDIRKEDIEAAVHWEDRVAHERARRKRFWRREAIKAMPPLGREWAAGYSPTLDLFSRELGGKPKGPGTARALGYHREIEELERVLSKAAENNVILNGESALSRNAVLEEFAHRITTGRSQGNLNWKRAVAADLGAAIAGLNTIGEIQERVRTIFFEAARAGNIILVVDNVHTFLGSESIAGVIDISGIILPFIRGTRLQLIGLTNPQGFRETVGRKQDLLSFFTAIELSELSPAILLQGLTSIVLPLEQRYRVFVTVPALRACIDYAERYVQDIPFPEKGAQLFEAALGVAANAKAPVLLPEHIAAAVSQRTHIPVGAVAESERKKLLGLEELLHRRVINQERAIAVVANAMRRGRAGLAVAKKRPLGAFLFLGPTGVGKTETAKALAEAYFGSEERMVRFDMSEYQGADAVVRFLGSPQARAQGTLTTAIRENPFSLLLLDEFEKTYPKALDLFLQVFDEGRLTDGWGRTVSFRNSIIIATSNAGAEFIRQRIMQNADPAALSEELIEQVLSQGLFRPELINRFDAVVVYRPLSEEHVLLVAQKMLKALSATLLKERGVTLDVVNDAVQLLAKEGYSPQFGGREMARVIQERVENAVAQKLLEGELPRGSVFRLTAADLQKSR